MVRLVAQPVVLIRKAVISPIGTLYRTYVVTRATRDPSREKHGQRDRRGRGRAVRGGREGTFYFFFFHN